MPRRNDAKTEPNATLASANLDTDSDETKQTVYRDGTHQEGPAGVRDSNVNCLLDGNRGRRGYAAHVYI